MAARKPARKKPTTKRTTSSAPTRKSTPSANKTPNFNKLAQASKVSGATRTPTRKTQTASTPGKKTPQTFQEAILHRKSTLKGVPIHVLNIPYEAQYFAKSLGVEYNPYLKMYLYEGVKLNPQLTPYKAEPFSLEKWVEDSLNGTEPAPLPPAKMKPRPHQVTAIKKIGGTAKTGWRGFVLADNVGLGKTLEGVFGAYLAAKQKGFTPQNKAKVLIVAPKSALPHWRNTLIATSIDNLKVVVINYDQSKKLLDAPASAQNVKKTVTVNRHTMTKGRPTIQWDIIIADESHKLKNESQRSAAFANIARYEANATKAPFVIWTSATVGQEPLELGYLAPLIGQMCGVPNLTHEKWGDWLISNGYNVKKSKAGNFSWVRPKGDTPPTERAEILALQQKDVSRLSELIFNDNSPSIRRNPEDIAGWPTQSYVATPVQLAPEGYRLYEEAWNEFRRYIGLNPRGKNPSGGLAATLRFRQKASMLSALATAEYVNDLLDNGLQVAISVEFIETLDVMKDYLSKKGWHVAEFSGRNTVDRENERLRFQKGEAQVMVFTVKEAISLHANEQLPDGTKATSAKRAMVVHDIRYSAIDMTQIIGRTTRDGELAIAYLMFTDATIEARILQTVLERMKNVRTLSGDDESTLLAVQNILDGI